MSAKYGEWRGQDVAPTSEACSRNGWSAATGCPRASSLEQLDEQCYSCYVPQRFEYEQVSRHASNGLTALIDFSASFVSDVEMASEAVRTSHVECLA